MQVERSRKLRRRRRAQRRWCSPPSGRTATTSSCWSRRRRLRRRRTRSRCRSARAARGDLPPQTRSTLQLQLHYSTTPLFTLCTLSMQFGAAANGLGRSRRRARGVGVGEAPVRAQQLGGRAGGDGDGHTGAARRRRRDGRRDGRQDRRQRPSSLVQLQTRRFLDGRRPQHQQVFGTFPLPFTLLHSSRSHRLESWTGLMCRIASHRIRTQVPTWLQRDWEGDAVGFCIPDSEQLQHQQVLADPRPQPPPLRPAAAAAPAVSLSPQLQPQPPVASALPLARGGSHRALKSMNPSPSPPGVEPPPAPTSRSEPRQRLAAAATPPNNIQILVHSAAGTRGMRRLVSGHYCTSM